MHRALSDIALVLQAMQQCLSTLLAPRHDVSRLQDEVGLHNIVVCYAGCSDAGGIPGN